MEDFHGDLDKGALLFIFRCFHLFSRNFFNWLTRVCIILSQMLHYLTWPKSFVIQFSTFSLRSHVIFENKIKHHPSWTLGGLEYF